MAVGVKDIAVAAGVSLGTVSNVLNHPDRVSARTRARVEQVMSDLGFVPNESARQLRAGRSRTLAYVVLDASNPFFTDVSRGVEETVAEKDLSLFMCNSDNRVDRENAYLTRLEEQRVAGVLVTPVDPDSQTLDLISGRGTPIVIVDRIRSRETHCSVAVDDVLGGRLAMEHLLDLGHQRVAFIGGPSSIGQVRDRHQGSLDALEDAGLSEDHLTRIDTASLSIGEGRLAAERLLGISSKRRPTAAFCANDLLALGLLQQCVASGVRVPDDLAIVGYDDIEYAGAAAVPLTSVRQPRMRLGRTAAELLLDEVDNPDHAHQQITFTPELVARASTATRSA
ncbi:LacI family transcriptional regulator [Nocardioides guangzhouensis]|uniref:LacI family transcriptional regulator n=1 Tax=Nocardioides guangzhouensis TaxID=2497878 RepID=A0A4Q4ZJ77_9ACTN|nr:LacI family DNA-binding transcriptional regulator [Nocardioides guangzhouensis]RYP88323.1 LacI family transcriptional regulator [Nocardioides guangzhouensis]